MVFRWVRFQSGLTFQGSNDNANGAMLFRSVRLRSWHVHTEYVAGGGASIFILYLSHKNIVTGIGVKDWAHMLQNLSATPSPLNPQDSTLSWEDEGYPLPVINPDSNDPTYAFGLYSSNGQPTSGFFISELQFTYDFPYGLRVVPSFVN